MSQRNSIDLESGVDGYGEFPKASASTNPGFISADARTEEMETQKTGKNFIVWFSYYTWQLKA